MVSTFMHCIIFLNVSCEIIAKIFFIIFITNSLCIKNFQYIDISLTIVSLWDYKIPESRFYFYKIKFYCAICWIIYVILTYWNHVKSVLKYIFSTLIIRVKIIQWQQEQKNLSRSCFNCRLDRATFTPNEVLSILRQSLIFSISLRGQGAKTDSDLFPASASGDSPPRPPSPSLLVYLLPVLGLYWPFIHLFVMPRSFVRW